VLSDSLTHLFSPGVALAPGSLRTGVVLTDNRMTRRSLDGSHNSLLLTNR